MDLKLTSKKNNNNQKKSTETLNYRNRLINAKFIWIILSLIAITFIVYSPISKNEFLNWDDNEYVYENNDIKSLNTENVRLLVTKDYVNVYLPLTMLSYAIDYKIGGLNPKVYTYTNLIIHILNSLLVYYLVLLIIVYVGSKIKIPDLDFKKQNLIAAITSLMFAIHPINVESVAWISERKNILFTFFFLLSIISYIHYLKKARYLFYFLSLLLFLCSLLSKGVAVSLSLCILALDYLYERKFFTVKVILEKIPYFLLSIIFGIIVIIYQGKENVGNSNTIFNQIVYASCALIGYLSKLAVPVNLSAYYSYPQGIHLFQWMCFILSIAIIITLFAYRKQLPRLIIFAILFFLANIIFLLQVVPVGNAIMADRYIYLSSIGFFLIAGIIIIRIASVFRFVYILLVVSFILYGFKTHERVKIWNNSFLFWNTIIDKDTTISTAYRNRGCAKYKLKDYQGAIEDYNKAIQIKPEYEVTYYNRGIAKYELKDHQGAIEDYNKAIQIKPEYEEAYYNRGIAKIELKDIHAGLDDLNQAIRIKPNYSNAYCYRGNVKREMGDNNGALNDFNLAIEIRPDFKEAYNNRGIVYYTLGKKEEALSDFTKAIELDSSYADSYYNRAKYLKITKDYKGALADLNKAIYLNPLFINAFTLRAKVRLKLNDPEGAVNDCKTALQFNNSLSYVYITLSVSYYKLERFKEAIDNINIVLQNNQETGILFFIRGMSEMKLNNKDAGNSDLLTAKKLGFEASENELTTDIK